MLYLIMSSSINLTTISIAIAIAQQYDSAVLVIH